MFTHEFCCGGSHIAMSNYEFYHYRCFMRVFLPSMVVCFPCKSWSLWFAFALLFSIFNSICLCYCGIHLAFASLASHASKIYALWWWLYRSVCLQNCVIFMILHVLIRIVLSLSLFEDGVGCCIAYVIFARDFVAIDLITLSSCPPAWREKLCYRVLCVV